MDVKRTTRIEGASTPWPQSPGFLQFLDVLSRYTSQCKEFPKVQRIYGTERKASDKMPKQTIAPTRKLSHFVPCARQS